MVKRLPLDGSLASLGSELVNAAVEGYMAAADGGAEDSVPIEHLQDQVAELTAVHRVISAANSTLKLNDMLQETAQAVVAVTHADICSIFIYEPERDQLLLTATTTPTRTRRDRSAAWRGHYRVGRHGRRAGGRAAPPPIPASSVPR